MRRADRLFQIIQLLRTRQWVTAAFIAEELSISRRTVYRDIQDLSLSGTPILSETGKGYRLDKAYNLPPVTFSESELEALILGARMVQAWSDINLAADATSALQRIETVVPTQLKKTFESTHLMVPAFHVFSDVAENLQPLRQAIKQENKIDIDYKRADGDSSSRIIWPLGLFFWGYVWTLVAWCELRKSHRQFRIDRIQTLKILSSTYITRDEQTLNAFLLKVKSEKC